MISLTNVYRMGNRDGLIVADELLGSRHPTGIEG